MPSSLSYLLELTCTSVISQLILLLLPKKLTIAEIPKFLCVKMLHKDLIYFL